MADAAAFNLTAGLEAERKLMTTWVNEMELRKIIQ